MALNFALWLRILRAMRKLAAVLVVLFVSCMKPEGAPCVGAEASCIGTEFAQCTGGVMMPYACRGAAGCYVWQGGPASSQVVCDTSVAVAGEACPVLGLSACATDGGRTLLACRGGDAGVQSWAAAQECSGACRVAGDGIAASACAD